MGQCTTGANSRGLDVEFSLELPKLSVEHPKQKKRSGDVRAQELLLQFEVDCNSKTNL